MDSSSSTLGDSMERDSGTIGFEPRPPTFTELVAAIQLLWNPRTRTYFTRREAELILTTRNYVHY